MLPRDKLIGNIKTLTLISSCGCNLKCNYCLIGRSANEDSARLQIETMKALDDGTFLENTKKVFDKIEVPYNQISKMELWGQEPTLTLHLLTKHLEDWFETFSNINSMMFSTNCMAYPERITDFIIKLDSIITSQFSLTIQFSYDGDTSTNNIRGANDQIIYNNIKTILTTLNEHKFNNVQVSLYLHGVVSLELMKQIQTSEQILNYYNIMGQFGHDLERYSRNRNVYFDPVVSLSLETPVQASSADGILLAQFAQKSMALPESAFINYEATLPRRSLLVPQAGIQDIMYQAEVKSVDEFIDELFKNKEFYETFIAWSEGMPFCGTNHGDVHLMYDGTIVTCQNYIFDTKKEYLVADDDKTMAIKKAIIDKGLFINPITATQEEISKFFNIHYELKNSSYRFLLDHMITMMFWMSKAGQISRIYRDNEKLLVKHAIMTTIFNCCLYNNRLKNGSIFLRWDGFVRFFCNGYIDVVEGEINTLLNEGDKYDGVRILQ